MNATIRFLAITIFTLFFTLPPAPFGNKADAGESAPSCKGKKLFTAKTCAGDGLSRDEKRLIRLVNKYRGRHRLPPISASPSLSLVANRHVRDMFHNIGKMSHGWSNCPYNARDRKTYPCMWKAPQRFKTPYPGYGFENAGWYSGSMTAKIAFSGWKSSKPHNAVILNLKQWKKLKWQALGVAIYKHYAVVWFGREKDPAKFKR